MATSLLTPKNIFKKYEDAKLYTDQLTKPFPEFQRIARNRPYEGIDPAYPKTTDGTTASIIQKTPKRGIQQLPTGKIESVEAEPWLIRVAQFKYDNDIIPFANEDFSLIEKGRLIGESGLTFGFGVSLCPFLNHDGKFLPDMTLPYWGDVIIPRGKKSGRSLKYLFIRSWWQKSDVKALIDSENQLQAQATKRGETYEATWDTAALQKVLDAATEKDQQAKTPSEEERGVETSGIELITALQDGVGAKFYTFCTTGKVVVRTKTNKDPRGKMPVDWFYADTDGSNPLGRGIVELIGGLQNLIDSDMQMYQYNRALMLAPPVVKYGQIDDFKFAPNYVVEAQNLATDKIDVIEIDTSAVQQYPQLYGLQKSQLLNLVNSPDTSISSDAGNPGFSKTDAGVKQQQATISVDDNAFRKSWESWFESWSETAINLYFAERTGKEVCQLDDDTANDLRILAGEGKFDASLLSKDNKLIIDYDTATPALKFRVDASSSKMKDDAAQLQSLTGLLNTLESNELLQSVVPQDKIVATWNAIVASSGVENPEELSVDLDDFKKQQEQQSAQASTGPRITESADLVKLYTATADPGIQAQILQQLGFTPTVTTAPAAQPTQPAQVPPDDQAYIAQLKGLGLSDQAIQQAMTMLAQGANEHQIVQALSQGATHA